jgi:hypothetical protein
MIDADWLNRYIEAWLLHPHAGGPDGTDALERLVQFMSPSLRYEDVPSGMVFTGHDGVGQMCVAAREWSSDLAINVLTQQTNGSLYAFEGETTGTNTGAMGPMPATGRRFVLRGVSVGRVSDDGLVVEHRDYWDLGSFLTQIGMLPAPS